MGMVCVYRNVEHVKDFFPGFRKVAKRLETRASRQRARQIVDAAIEEIAAIRRDYGSEVQSEPQMLDWCEPGLPKVVPVSTIESYVRGLRARRATVSTAG
jgi:hypothetical protein